MRTSASGTSALISELLPALISPKKQSSIAPCRCRDARSLSSACAAATSTPLASASRMRCSMSPRDNGAAAALPGSRALRRTTSRQINHSAVTVSSSISAEYAYSSAGGPALSRSQTLSAASEMNSSAAIATMKTRPMATAIAIRMKRSSFIDQVSARCSSIQRSIFASSIDSGIAPSLSTSL